MSWLWWLDLVLLGVLLVVSTANLSLRLPSRARLAEMLERRGRRDELDRLLAHRLQLLLATAIVRLGCTLGFAFVTLAGLLHKGWPIGAQTYTAAGAVSLMAVLLCSTAIPNAWARYGGESLLIAALPLLHALRLGLYPLVMLLVGVDWVIRRLAGVSTDEETAAADAAEQEILSVVSEGEARGAVDEEEKEMIESVIELRDAQVDQIMTPRTDITAVPKEVALAELKEVIRETGHSRIPVYEETVDNILGVVYAKDLLHIPENGAFEVTRVMRPAIYIPESKQVRDLLHEFQEGKGHMAIVLDEYGGTAGLVTIEDILEELVGEIVDEYEEQENEPLVYVNDHTVEVDARMRIDELNDRLHLDLPESEDYETIGGLVFSTLGKIPQAGEECEVQNVKLRVTQAEPRRINRLRLQLPVPVPRSNGARE